jgi:hypothetical protein
MSVLYADAMESINCSVKCDLEATADLVREEFEDDKRQRRLATDI